jgi:predicted TPR repeat methyltransferase
MSRSRRANRAPAELRVPEALQLAVTVHRRGGLDDAQTLYERILKAAPGHADALHFLGVLLHQRGRSERALELIRRSIAVNSAVPDWHNNAGNVLLEMGRVDEAAQAYEEAARLAPDRADIQNNLGALRRHQQRPVEAEAAYRRAIELDPKYADAYTNLGSLLDVLGRKNEALAAYCEALVLMPRHSQARKLLGVAYYTLGRLDEAARVYREWMDEEPANPVPRHYLAACTGEDVPRRADDGYVQNVFDRFADSFDAKLAKLHYRAPELIAQAVAGLCGAPRKALDVLDAGCGTGLCGPLLAPYARRLDGVDLSAQMLAKAEPRQVYDRLARAELTAFIEAAPAQSYDLIVSADTLCYFGELHGVARAAMHALRPGGGFVFTVEALDAGPPGAGYHLNPHGRYSHAQAYVREALEAAGFAPVALQRVHLRTEGGKPVEGWLATAQAAASPATDAAAREGAAAQGA